MLVTHEEGIQKTVTAYIQFETIFRQNKKKK
jgi:hypothetical protein